MDLFRTIIVTASDAPACRQIAANSSSSGLGMWATGLSASGTAPATHFISSGMIPEDIFSALAQDKPVFSRSDISEQPPFEAMARLGLKIINPTET